MPKATRTTRRAVLGSCLALAALLAGIGIYRAATPSGGSTLVILTSWTDQSEADAFQAVANTFMAENPGVHIEIEASRDEQEVLQSGLRDGDPPDLAVVPSPGELATYVTEDYLIPLDGLIDHTRSKQLSAELHSDFGPMWNGVMDAGTGHPYGLVVKADVKSLIWYGPGLPAADAAAPPSDWSRLLALGNRLAAGGTAPWCVGLLDSSTAGWPGADWIGDVLLQQDGPAVYDEWVKGRLQWTSPDVTAAWETWGRLMSAPGQVYGGALNALSMPAGETDNAMFAPKSAGPGCALSHGALLETSPQITPRAGTYNYFAFPGAAAQHTYEVSADLMGMLVDTPQAEKFAVFLAGPNGQSIWPSQQLDSAFSAYDSRAAQAKITPLYKKDDVARGIENILTGSPNTLCYGASDMMPPVMEAAFERAVLEYVADPARLHSVLTGLDRIRPTSYQHFPPLTACASGN
jgi:alpha-glucoside transport system substrate-binding protein